jgi:hypothetical protein
MNRTTKVAVALIAAAGLSTMVYALPEQRAMAHPRLDLLSSNLDPDDFPFGPNSPNPPLSASKSDPPPSPPGPPFGPNLLANGAVTNPKLAPGSVSSADIGAGQVTTPNIADQAVATPKISHGALFMNTVDVIGPSTQLAAGTDGYAIAVCPSGTVVTGGGYFAGGSTVITMHTTAPNNWRVEAIAGPTSTTLTAIAKCASIHLKVEGGRGG